MEFDSVINKRFSCRAFKDKNVSYKDVLLAIDAANQGPFAGNHNHLKFLIIEDEKSIEEIAKHSEQLWINRARIVVLVLSDDTQLEKLYGVRGRVYSRQQSGAAINTLLLKLHDLGLSGCWVGAYTDEMIKQLLGIPQHVQIEAVIPLGYPKEKAEKKRKKEIENTTFWEKWDNSKRHTFIQEGKDPDPTSLV